MAKNKVLNITEIEDGVKKILSNRGDDFITQFLSLYDIPKSRLHVQNRNSIMVNHL